MNCRGVGVVDACLLGLLGGCGGSMVLAVGRVLLYVSVLAFLGGLFGVIRRHGSVQRRSLSNLYIALAGRVIHADAAHGPAGDTDGPITRFEALRLRAGRLRGSRDDSSSRLRLVSLAKAGDAGDVQDLVDRVAKRLVLVAQFSGHEDLDLVVNGRLESARILSAVVRENGQTGSNLVQGDGCLLDNFNGDRLRRSKVPNLLALGFSLFESCGHGSGIEVFLSLAKVKTLGDEIARRAELLACEGMCKIINTHLLSFATVLVGSSSSSLSELDSDTLTNSLLLVPLVKGLLLGASLGASFTGWVCCLGGTSSSLSLSLSASASACFSSSDSSDSTISSSLDSELLDSEVWAAMERLIVFGLGGAFMGGASAISSSDSLSELDSDSSSTSILSLGLALVFSD